MYKKQIADFIDTHKEEMVDLLKQFVAIPSVAVVAHGNMPFGENVDKMLKFAQKTADEIGFNTSNFDNQSITVDLNDKKTTTQILCHLDVVPVNKEKWTHDPFDAVIKDNIIYGRGVADNKGASVAALYALYALKELDIPLDNNVKLYFGGCEESGCRDIKHYLKSHTMPEYVFVPDACFPVGNGERGRIVVNGNAEIKCNKLLSLKSGTALNIVPEYAEATFADVSMCDIEGLVNSLVSREQFVIENDKTVLKVFGKSTHAAHPEHGVNALTAMLKVIEKIEPEAEIFSQLAHVFPHNKFHGEGLRYENIDFSFSITQANLENGVLRYTADGRTGLNESADEIASRAEKLLGKNAKIDVTPPHYVDENSEIVQKLQKVYMDTTGATNIKPFTLDAMTYAHYIDNAVIFGSAYGSGCGNAHGNDECFNLDALYFSAKIFAYAILELNGQN